MADSSNNSIFIPNTFGSNAFRLKHKGDSIFHKQFDSETSTVVDVISDTVIIKNHFFVTGEKLNYSYVDGNSRIGISPSSPGNTLGTSFLPDEIYPIVVTGETLRFSFTRDLALQNQYIDITEVGIGVQAFTSEKQNSKCLISIDNIIQSPISVASTVGIIDIVNSKTIVLDSLEGIYPGTILKLSNEYAKVISVQYSDNVVGIGTVIILRGESVLGTPEEVWNSSLTTASVMSGQYNIIKDKIYFTSSPFEGQKYNYTLIPEDFELVNFSFNIFNTNIKTGSVVGIITQNPPSGLDAGRFYYAIKNYENNFSFADNYQNAINGTRVEFDLNSGQYDPVKKPGEMILSFLDFSNGSSFSGRAFMRSDYSGNAVFDDISEQFNGISTSFELKTSGVSTVGISSDNGIVLINNIFQYPEFEESFIYEEDSLAGVTSVTFIGIGTDGDLPKDYDVNVKGHPRGGIIVGYGLSGGTNYQPLRQAKLYETSTIVGPTGYVIDQSNIGIAYSGSGYRNEPGYAVSITFEENGERIVGYGTGIIQNGNIIDVDIIENCIYEDIDSPPKIVIEPPFEYENIPLIGSVSGTGARVSFDISDSGDVGNFKFTNFGYGYNAGEILTLSNIVGKSSQISSEELKILVLNVDKDKFSAWNVGRLRKLDDLSSYANGSRKIFSLLENGQLVSVESLPGSPIELSQTLLVFVNDVLQIPDDSYTFDGGTQIEMVEAPPKGSTIKVYFYEGSDGDTVYNDIIARIKVGDNVEVKKKISKNPETQFKRTVKRILSSDRLKTEIYDRKGLSYNSFTYRPIDMTPQKRDLIIGGEIISKSRESLESNLAEYTLITNTTGTFSVSYASTIGINTTGIQIGDSVESIYTDSYTVTSISPGVIGISTNSTTDAPTSTSINIWRKNS
jgi:hypothetical protein